MVKVPGRVSYRILSWGGEQDGSRMIVACTKARSHTCKRAWV